MRISMEVCSFSFSALVFLVESLGVSVFSVVGVSLVADIGG